LKLSLEVLILKETSIILLIHCQTFSATDKQAFLDRKVLWYSDTTREPN